MKKEIDSRILSTANSDQEFGVGVLKLLWSKDRPLPLVSSAEKIIFLFTKGLKLVCADFISNFFSILSVFLSLFLFSLVLLISSNIGTFLSSVSKPSDFTVFFSNNVIQSEIEQTVLNLKSDKSIKEASVVSKDSALKFLDLKLNMNDKLFSSLEDDNPLPVSADFKLVENVTSSEFDALIQKAKAQNSIDEIIYPGGFLSSFLSLTKKFKILSFLFVFFSFFIVAALICNTIRLHLLSKKEEIEVMKLVGASDFEIVFPYVVSGVFQGLLGAILSILSLKIIYFLLRPLLSQTFLDLGINLNLSFLSVFSLAFVITMGGGIGLFGSLFSIKPYVKS